VLLNGYVTFLQLDITMKTMKCIQSTENASDGCKCCSISDEQMCFIS